MKKLMLLSAAATAALGSMCLGGFTNVGTIPPAEQSQEMILETLYGGDFVSDGENFSNGSITVRRVPDSGAITDDQIDGVKITARPVAKFANGNQSLKLVKDGSTSALFDITGYGYDLDTKVGEGASVDEATFSLTGRNSTQSSMPADNEDGRDHLITYDVVGVPANQGQSVWLQFWEDMNLGSDTPKKRSTSDFNDLVVEVRATAIPLPAAVWVGGAAIGAAGVMRNRLRKLAGI